MRLAAVAHLHWVENFSCMTNQREITTKSKFRDKFTAVKVHLGLFCDQGSFRSDRILSCSAGVQMVGITLLFLGCD